MNTPIAEFIEKMRDCGMISVTTLNSNLVLTDALQMEEEKLKQFALICLNLAERDNVAKNEYKKLIDIAYEEHFS